MQAAKFFCPVDAAAQRMCRLLEHRGPDSRGVHLEGGVGLGIQRLRVIDLQTGDQPIYNEDRSVAVVFNGEIYNYRELREELRSRGTASPPSGDTEVIVHLYEELRAPLRRAPARDVRVRALGRAAGGLLLARDRVGKKPLVYALRDGELSLRLGAGALLAGPRDRRARSTMRARPLPRTTATSRRPLSAFRGVQSCRPRTRLVLRGRRGRDRALLAARLLAASARTRSARSSRARSATALRAAMRRRMMADVPLGAFLSGGIDSSAVVAAMAERSSEPVRTFSIGFDHRAVRRAAVRAPLAEHFGTDHEEFDRRARRRRDRCRSSSGTTASRSRDSSAIPTSTSPR